MAADHSPAGRRKARLKAEAGLLAPRYTGISFDQMDGAWLHVPRFPLPPGWSKQEVEILIDIPYGNPGYPAVAPQWFWTDLDLRTSGGKPINHFFSSASSHTSGEYLQKGWGHFCVHVSEWHPASDRRIAEGHTLQSYLNLIATIFRDRRTLARR
jgi:hypothetical protein